MKKANNKIVRYKMANYVDPNVNVDFHISNISNKTKHQHEYWEILLVFENGIINVVNDERIELNAEEAIIVRPDDIHYTQNLKGVNHQLLNIEVRKGFFEDVLNLFAPSTLARLNAYPRNIPKIKCSFAVYEKILHLIRLSQRYPEVGSAARQALSREMLMCILFEYEEQFRSEQISDTEDRSFSTVMMALFNQKENIGLKLHEVCAKYPCSVEYAIRRFKIEGVETPNVVFKKIKLEHACILLKSSDYKILTICEKIGFNSLGHFNKVFLQAYGITPSEYRKKHRAKN